MGPSSTYTGNADGIGQMSQIRRIRRISQIGPIAPIIQSNVRQSTPPSATITVPVM